MCALPGFIEKATLPTIDGRYSESKSPSVALRIVNLDGYGETDGHDEAYFSTEDQFPTARNSQV